MRRGFEPAQARGFDRPLRAIGEGNPGHFRQQAIQHLRAALAAIGRAEQCKPGSTNDAERCAHETIDQITKAPSLWPPVVETKG